MAWICMAGLIKQRRFESPTLYFSCIHISIVCTPVVYYSGSFSLPPSIDHCFMHHKGDRVQSLGKRISDRGNAEWQQSPQLFSPFLLTIWVSFGKMPLVDLQEAILFLQLTHGSLPEDHWQTANTVLKSKSASWRCLIYAQTVPIYVCWYIWLHRAQGRSVSCFNTGIKLPAPQIQHQSFVSHCPQSSSSTEGSAAGVTRSRRQEKKRFLCWDLYGLKAALISLGTLGFQVDYAGGGIWAV